MKLKEQGADPAPLRERPFRQPEFAWLFEAYDLLSRSRQIGMTEFFIPMSEYLAYAQLIDLDDVEQRLFMVSVLTQVDATLLAERMKDREAKI